MILVYPVDLLSVSVSPLIYAVTGNETFLLFFFLFLLHFLILLFFLVLLFLVILFGSQHFSETEYFSVSLCGCNEFLGVSVGLAIGVAAKSYFSVLLSELKVGTVFLQSEQLVAISYDCQHVNIIHFIPSILLA